jgi:hypothetical protein
MLKKKGIVMLLALTIVSACGGGGGGSGGGGGVQQPTSAVMHVLTSAGSTSTYGSSGILGVGLTVTFPPGVTVKTDSAGTVDISVAVPSGVTAGQASVLPPLYTAATTTLPGRLDLVVASTTVNGFGTGEILTINFIISSGSPTAGSFTITNFAPMDLLAQPITGMGSGSTVSFQ